MKLLQELLTQRHDARHLVKFPILYYGGCRGAAEMLVKSGYNPSIINSKPLILTSTPELAQQKAAERNCDYIVKVSDVPAHLLELNTLGGENPMDIYDALEQVQRGDKIILKLTKQLGAPNFKILNKLHKS